MLMLLPYIRGERHPNGGSRNSRPSLSFPSSTAVLPATSVVLPGEAASPEDKNRQNWNNEMLRREDEIKRSLYRRARTPRVHRTTSERVAAVAVAGKVERGNLRGPGRECFEDARGLNVAAM